MNNTPTPHPLLPHQAISLRMAYWLVLVSLAAMCWFLLLKGLLPDPGFRAMLDATTRSAVTEKMFSPGVRFGQPTWWVMEEVIFRGILLQVLRRRFSLRMALFVSATLFSLAHFAYGGLTMTFAFAASYYFAWLMIRTNSIYAPIIAHWFFDFCGLYVLLPLLGATGRLEGAVSFPWWVWPLSATVIVAGVRVLRREFLRGTMSPAIVSA